MANFLSRALLKHRSRSGPAREAGRLVIGLGVGLVVVPVLVFIAGQVALGDYLRDPATGETGGPWTFFWDYVRGLASASPGHWGVLLGPYVLYTLLRLGRRALKV